MQDWHPPRSGSASDVIARLVPNRMEGPLGQRFIVTNIPAAGGVTGTLTASKAAPKAAIATPLPRL